MSERAVPFHCPYCGDVDLRPHEAEPTSGHASAHGAWECRACLRAFSLKMLGLIPHGGSAPVDPPASSPRPTGSEVQR